MFDRIQIYTTEFSVAFIIISLLERYVKIDNPGKGTFFAPKVEYKTPRCTSTEAFFRLSLI